MTSGAGTVIVDGVNTTMTTTGTAMPCDTDPTSSRARRLRRQAQRVHPIAAQAFRRRACEVEFERWVRQIARAGSAS